MSSHRLRNEDGASAVEYGLLVAAVAGVIVILVFGLGLITQQSYSTTCNNLESQMKSGASC